MKYCKLLLLNFLCSLFWLLLLAIKCNAQSPFFTRTLGSSTEGNFGYAVHQIANGNIYMAGYSEGGADNSIDAHLFCLDENGIIIWQKKYGTSNDDYVVGMLIDEENKAIYLYGDDYDNALNNPNALLIKLDLQGNQLWLKSFGTNTFSESISKMTLSGGELFATGFKTGQQANDFLFMKFNSDGIALLDTSYYSNSNNVASSIVVNEDGNIFIAGDRQKNDFSYNAFTMLLNPEGGIIWQKMIENEFNGGVKNCILNSDNEFLIVGESSTQNSSSFDITLSKMNKQGDILYFKHIPLSSNSDAGFGIAELTPQKYIITGYSYHEAEPVNGTDIIQLLVDENANELDKSYVGFEGFDISYQVVKSINSGFLIAGTCDKENDRQFCLIYNSFETVFNADLMKENLKVSFNIIGDNIVLSGFESGSYSVIDISGRLLEKASFSSSEISIKKLPSSSYYCLRINEKTVGLFYKK